MGGYDTVTGTMAHSSSHSSIAHPLLTRSHRAPVPVPAAVGLNHLLCARTMATCISQADAMTSILCSYTSVQFKIKIHNIMLRETKAEKLD